MPRTQKSSTPKPSTKPTIAEQAGSAVEAIKEAPKSAEARVKALIESGTPAIERAQGLVS